jgi:RNA polymerase sigma factor (sigma-70 family)
MEEYRIDIKVRNNVIISKIESAGYKSVGEFCRLNQIMKYVSRLGNIIAMKSSPLSHDGNFKPCITKAADLLGCDPIDLFTDTQLNTILKTNKRSLQINEAEVKFMLESSESRNKMLEVLVEEEQRNKKIDEALSLLTPRQRLVIEMRMGMGEYTTPLTLDECGNILGVGRERIRQIEAKSLRKLRHPLRSERLSDFI